MSSYDYDENAAGHADDVANRIDTSAAYVGRFKVAHAIKSEKGTEGIHFEFNAPGGGTASFDLWTRKEDGTPVFGMNQVQAMMLIFGVRGLRTSPGRAEIYDRDAGKRIEADVEVFKDLMDKDIGVVLQKELYTKNDGKEGFRMNLFGVFHPVSKLTASEIKERKAEPAKLERMLRGLKNKDSRRTVEPEPSQPPAGAVAGGY